MEKYLEEQKILQDLISDYIFKPEDEYKFDILTSYLTKSTFPEQIEIEIFNRALTSAVNGKRHTNESYCRYRHIENYLSATFEGKIMTIQEMYTSILLPTPENESIVWSRVLNGKESDLASLFLGYSNNVTSYGDEGSQIFPTTPKYSRTVFFNGGSENLYYKLHNDSFGGVDQKVYNHFYGDFGFLKEEFPYLIDSNFFDCIFIGSDTFLYMTSCDILINLSTMVKKSGSILIAIRNKMNYIGPKFTEILGDKFTSLPYFYVNPREDQRNFCIDFHCYTKFGKDWYLNSVDSLREKFEDSIPFSKNFFDQNRLNSSFIVVINKGK